MYRPSEYEEMLRFEQKAWMQFEEPGNDGIDRTPDSLERELTRLEGWLDESHYDDEGVVFP
jgi:hypothetical protein